MANDLFDVCIVGLKCYDLLVDSPVPKYLGGIERTLVAFARTLAAKGVRVAFVTYDEGQPDTVDAGGITIFKAHDAKAGIPFLRMIHPRMTAIWRAMQKAAAPIYVQMGGGVETMAVALGVRLVGRGRARFVFCTASNMDCESHLSGIKSQHERLLYRLALRLTDQVICQTRTQADMLRRNYRLDSLVVPMPFEAPKSETEENPGEVESARPPFRNPSEEYNLLWVGRTVEVKRLEWFLDLAERMDQATFHIVGSANQSSEYAAAQMERAGNLANVVVHGRISDAELNALYQKAFALCCTSIIEGFPTTFLEAWKIGLPVVTTFDPDGLVASTGAGFAVSDVQEFEAALTRLRSDREVYVTASGHCLRLYEERFSPDAIIGRYLTLFDMRASAN